MTTAYGAAWATVARPTAAGGYSITNRSKSGSSSGNRAVTVYCGDISSYISLGGVGLISGMVDMKGVNDPLTEWTL